MRSGFLNACSPTEASMPSSSATLEKGVRNKRKLRTANIHAAAPQTPDCGLEDGAGECCSSWTTSSSCLLNSVEAGSYTPDGASCCSIGAYNLPHSYVTHRLDVVNMLSSSAAPGVMASGFCHGFCKEDTDLQEPDWDKNSESKLENILINMLDALYKDAVAKIISLGHSQKNALNAVLKNGRWNGKDALTSVVDSSLTWLQSGEARQGILDFTNLKDMERHVLTEMVCLLRKVRPFLSKGEAMWCLLVCDMNLLLACAMEDDVVSPPMALNLKTSLRPSVQNTAVPLPQQTPHLSPGVVQLTSGGACKQPPGGSGNFCSDNKSAFSTPSFSSSPVGKVAVASRQINIATSSSTSKSAQPPPIRPCSKRSAGQNLKAEASNTLSSPNVVAAKMEVLEHQKLELDACKCVSGDEHCTNGPCLSSGTLNESMNLADMCAVFAREKHVLKLLRNHCLSQTFQAAFETSSGKQEAHNCSDSGPVRLNCRDSHAFDVEGKKADYQACNEKSGQPGFPMNTRPGGLANSTNRSSVHESELCLATNQATSPENSSSSQGVSCKVSTSKIPCHVYLCDQTLGCSGADGEQRKTEILLHLIERVKCLESQLQEWSDWAQQKVMQAAQRLRKDSSELKALRLERDEYVRLKKEKQTLEESTMKKLSEMEIALRKALNQVDRANTAARRLKTENAEVRAEMEAAKLTAAEYVSACQEVAKKENKSVTKTHVWEKQKVKLQDELTEQKRQLTTVLKQLSVAKEQCQQAGVRWRQEKKAKEEALNLSEFEKRAKEQVELTLKRHEEALQRKAEAESKCHREEVRRLQSEISQLKASLGLQPSLTWSGSRLEMSHSCSAESYKQINARLLAEIASLQNAQREIPRDRECVMCMNEERSVVFLPCAHQVICIACNELHVRHGRKDCPSCRTGIQQRIRVYGVNST
ncbi:hypothetical protein L7F22_010513 [Adiantum nelumboides]|nr:hypothetical protein [Adiantum nelumboides]